MVRFTFPVAALLISTSILSAQENGPNQLLNRWLNDLPTANITTRRQILSSLGRFREEQPRIRKHLHQHFENEKIPHLRMATLYALARLSPQMDSLPTIKKGLKDSEATVRTQACTTLSSLPNPEVVLPLLIESGTKDPSTQVRSRVLSLSYRFQSSSREFLPLIKKALKESDAIMINAALYAITQLSGALELKDLPILLSGFEVKHNPNQHETLALSVSKLGVKAIPALRKALKHEVPSVRSGAALTICYLGADAKVAVPDLKKLLKEDNIWAMMAATRALWTINGPSGELLKPMLKRQESLDSGFSRQISGTLQRLGYSRASVLANLLKQKDVASRRLGVLGLSLAPVPNSEEARLALLKSLSDSDEKVRETAINALSRLPMARDDLFELLSSRRLVTRRAAAKALGRSTSGLKPKQRELARALNDKDPITRLHLARAMGTVTGQPQKILGIVAPGLNSKDVEQRRVAIDAFGAFRTILLYPRNQPLAPVLNKFIETALSDDDLEVRLRAAELLFPQSTYQIDLPRLKRLVPVLAKGLTAKRASLRKMAAKCLVMVQSEATPAKKELILALKDESPAIRQKAAFLLAKISSDASEAVPGLIALLKDPWEINRKLAAQALGAIGPKAKSAVAALIQTAKDSNSGACLSAVEALGKIGPAAAKAVPTLIHAFNHGTARGISARISYHGYASPLANPRSFASGTERVIILKSLGEIGTAATSAVPHIVKAMSGSKNLETVAVWALSKIGGRGTEALLKGLTHPSESFRVLCVQSLSEMSPSAKLLQGLRTALSDASTEVRRQALFALALQGEQAGQAREDLMKLWRNPKLSAEIRSDLVRTLFDIAPTHAESRLVFLASLQNDDPLTRQLAAEGLGKSGREAKEAVVALKRLLKDDDSLVRQAAADALKKIQK